MRYCLAVLLLLPLAAPAQPGGARPATASAADSLYIMSQFRKAKVLERDDPDSSLHCCERLLEKSLQANFTYGTGLLLVNLGYLEITTSRYSKALDYFRRSFPYLEVTPGNRHLVVNA